MNLKDLSTDELTLRYLKNILMPGQEHLGTEAWAEIRRRLEAAAQLMLVAQHKHFDPDCAVNGCQSLKLKAAEKPREAEAAKHPICDDTGICEPMDGHHQTTNCLHCGKELQKINGTWKTWDHDLHTSQPPEAECAALSKECRVASEKLSKIDVCTSDVRYAIRILREAGEALSQPCHSSMTREKAVDMAYNTVCPHSSNMLHVCTSCFADALMTASEGNK